MSTQITINANRSAFLDEKYSTTNFSSSTTAVFDGDIYKRGLLCGFADTQLQAYPYRRILRWELEAYSALSGQSFGELRSVRVLSAWSENAVTYATRPSTAYLKEYANLFGSGYDRAPFDGSLSDLFGNGVQLDAYPQNGIGTVTLDTSRGSHPPRVVIELADDDVAPTITGAPSGGYKNKHEAITLQWTLGQSAASYVKLAQTNATVRWREGSSGEVHTITNKQTVTTHTLAAETVTGDELQWQVTVTCNSSDTITSPWYVVSTQDATPSQPEIIRPQDTLVDASQPITLEWRHVISTGTAQTAAEIQTSPDGTTWSVLANITGAANTFTIPANTLTGGTLWWAVKTYNADGVASPWDSTKVDVVAGPGTPVVACTTAPRPEITWQAAGQQGFEVEIGGQSSGVVYGTGKAWQPPEFLPDGPAVARVRVVNSFGLWSDWGEVNVTISNPSSGAAFAVTTYAGREVGLTWSAVTGASAYWIYRDGVKIGQTEELQYTDRWSNGSSVWKVRAIIGDGYRDSAEAAATVQLRFPIVSALDGSWIELKYSTEAVPTVQTVNGRDVALLSVQGAAFPMLEASPYRTRTYAITAAFPRSVGPAAFEALLGREVVLKDQYGKVLHGVMAPITTTANRFFYVCSAQLQETEGVE